MKDYDCIIDYHPKKVNVVANALSKKGRNTTIIARLGVLFLREIVELKKLNVEMKMEEGNALIATLKV